MKSVQRLLMVPEDLDAKLVESAKAQGVTVQALILQTVAKAHKVKIEIRTRGQRGPGKKKEGE